MDIPEDSKLQAITRKLAGILRIQDWDISVHAVSGYELAQKTGLECDTDGVSYRNVRLNTADIYLNKEKDADWYETLVHEMIHVQTVPMEHCATAYFEEPKSYFKDILENMVEKQAQVFVKIYPLSRLEKEGITDGKEKGY